jgi:outer membrane immunogenic protein
MRTMVAAAFALGVIGAAATGAAAADLPPAPYYYSAPPVVAGFSWIGPYIGANIGYQWGEVSNNPTKPSGAAGGVQAGFNWQHGSFVYGVESDIELSGAEDTFAPWQFSNPWFGTLRGRAGVAINNVLVYGTAGVAYGDLRVQTNNLSESKGDIGWVAGGGVEVGFTPHWSAKAEWLYIDLSDRSFALTGSSNGLASNLLRLGVNYRF